MDTKELIEYMSHVVNLEKRVYTLRKTIDLIDEKINSLEKNIQNWDNAVKIAYQNIGNTTYKNTNSSTTSFFDIYIAYIKYSSILGISAFVFMFLFYIMKLNAVMGLIIGVIIGVLIVKGITKTKKSIKNKSLNREEALRAEIERKYADEKSANRDVVNKKSAQEIANLRTERPEFCKVLESTYDALDEIYAFDIIPVKYRELVPVCMFYEYLINGRTYSLVRNPSAFDEGAINMYEDELYKQQIVSSLDNIYDKLLDIESNQKILCDTIRESSARIEATLSNINNSIDNMSYIQECIADNTETIKWCELRKIYNE